jgi:hypothetical protein
LVVGHSLNASNDRPLIAASAPLLDDGRLLLLSLLPFLLSRPTGIGVDDEEAIRFPTLSPGVDGRPAAAIVMGTGVDVGAAAFACGTNIAV